MLNQRFNCRIDKHSVGLSQVQGGRQHAAGHERLLSHQRGRLDGLPLRGHLRRRPGHLLLQWHHGPHPRACRVAGRYLLSGRGKESGFCAASHGSPLQAVVPLYHVPHSTISLARCVRVALPSSVPTVEHHTWERILLWQGIETHPDSWRRAISLPRCCLCVLTILVPLSSVRPSSGCLTHGAYVPSAESADSRPSHFTAHGGRRDAARAGRAAHAGVLPCDGRERRQDGLGRLARGAQPAAVRPRGVLRGERTEAQVRLDNESSCVSQNYDRVVVVSSSSCLFNVGRLWCLRVAARLSWRLSWYANSWPVGCLVSRWMRSASSSDPTALRAASLSQPEQLCVAGVRASRRVLWDPSVTFPWSTRAWTSATAAASATWASAAAWRAGTATTARSGARGTPWRPVRSSLGSRTDAVDGRGCKRMCTCFVSAHRSGLLRRASSEDHGHGVQGR